MLINLRTIDNSASINSDICIIGAGAAGITIALEFAGKPVQVVLLESGGTAPDLVTQSLYDGDHLGLMHERLDESRSRYFGGSTNCWGGWCRPLDEIDFEARSWMPNSGWPFGRDELLPYYRRAHSLLELGPFDYGYDHWAPALAREKVALFPIEGTRLDNAIDQLSPPTQFGAVYRPQISEAKNIRAFLYANVTEINTDETAKTATGAQAATLNGKSFTVRARTRCSRRWRDRERQAAVAVKPGSEDGAWKWTRSRWPLLYGSSAHPRHPSRASRPSALSSALRRNHDQDSSSRRA